MNRRENAAEASSHSPRSGRTRRSRAVSALLAWIVPCFTVTAALFGMTLAVGTPTAFAGTGSCPSTYACAWVDNNFNNSQGQWAGNNSNWSVFGQPNCQKGNWNDCASSVYNHGTSCTVHFYRDAGYQNTRLDLGIGNTYNDLRSQSFNDIISSNNWC